MKALTISQPFASLIASGEKWVENRTWRTTYRGELAIHAGRGTQYLTRRELAEYPSGCVIATARLAACVSLMSIQTACDNEKFRDLLVKHTSRTWSELAKHEHAEGPWCWILEDVERIEPVSANGKQGLWEWGRAHEVPVARRRYLWWVSMPGHFSSG